MSHNVICMIGLYLVSGYISQMRFSSPTLLRGLYGINCLSLRFWDYDAEIYHP